MADVEDGMEWKPNRDREREQEERDRELISGSQSEQQSGPSPKGPKTTPTRKRPT